MACLAQWGKAVPALGQGKPMTKLAVPTFLEKRESSRMLKGVQHIFAGPNNAACLTETEALVWGACTSG